MYAHLSNVVLLRTLLSKVICIKHADVDITYMFIVYFYWFCGIKLLLEVKEM